MSEGRVHGKAALARLVGIDTREAAIGLKGLDVAVSRDRLPPAPEGEYYWTDLEGMEVFNRGDESLGKVRELFNNGAQCVLVVSRGSGENETLIPFVAAYVDGVDVAVRRIRVDWQSEWT